MKFNRLIILITVLFLVLNLSPVYAQDSDWLEIGVRVGAADDDDEDFEQYDIFTVYRLPWQWDWDSGWSLGTRLNASIGLLSGGDEEGVAVSLGAGFELFSPGKRFSATIGSSPTYLSEDRYGQKDLGGNFHFTSHIGFNYQIGEHFTLGYRFHHISNASLEDTNPGLDIHNLSLGYRF